MSRHPDPGGADTLPGLRRDLRGAGTEEVRCSHDPFAGSSGCFRSWPWPSGLGGGRDRGRPRLVLGPGHASRKQRSGPRNTRSREPSSIWRCPGEPNLPARLVRIEAPEHSRVADFHLTESATSERARRRGGSLRRCSTDPSEAGGPQCVDPKREAYEAARLSRAARPLSRTDPGRGERLGALRRLSRSCPGSGARLSLLEQGCSVRSPMRPIRRRRRRSSACARRSGRPEASRAGLSRRSMGRRAPSRTSRPSSGSAVSIS